jgi:hypothetical protein
MRASAISRTFAMRMAGWTFWFFKQALLDIKAIQYFPSVHISAVINHRSFLQYHHQHKIIIIVVMIRSARSYANYRIPVIERNTFSELQPRYLPVAMHPIPKSDASIPKYANNFISSRKMANMADVAL